MNSFYTETLTLKYKAHFEEVRQGYYDRFDEAELMPLINKEWLMFDQENVVCWSV